MDAVNEYLNQIESDQRREDTIALIEMCKKATGDEPVMWGNIVGFGKNHYKYESGHEGDTMAVGFAARKNALVLYGVFYYDLNAEAVKEVGKVKLGKGCIYINKLSDINTDVLSKMIKNAYTLRNNA